MAVRCGLGLNLEHKICEFGRTWAGYGLPFDGASAEDLDGLRVLATGERRKEKSQEYRPAPKPDALTHVLPLLHQLRLEIRCSGV